MPKTDLRSALSDALPKNHTQAATPQHTLGMKPRVTKMSITLYGNDFARLDTIKEFMAERGIRNISDSEALRIANRGVALHDGLVDIYKAMLQEDGRRKTR